MENMIDVAPYQVVKTESVFCLLQRAVTSIANSWGKLILLIGVAGNGKTQILRKYASDYELPLLSLGLLITRAMQSGLQPEKLIGYLHQSMENLGEVVLLDNIEILFQPDLKLHVLQLLKLLSKERTIIAALPGRIVGGSLVYADASHPEYKVFSQYEIKDLIIFDLNGELK
ncbi:MAG: BREX-3 system P-loop-containing protein BrxF [Bacilli bacterium]|nr:BREX-3 system P-loop-containing protein BrxF [Bacilli bacterium]